MCIKRGWCECQECEPRIVKTEEIPVVIVEVQEEKKASKWGIFFLAGIWIVTTIKAVMIILDKT